MKIKRRDLPLLLPCVGLLGFGMALKPALKTSAPVAAAAPRAYVSIRPPERGIRWGVDGATVMRMSMNFVPRLDPRLPPPRWYYNSRIQGTLGNRPHIFYSSGGHDPYNCWTSSTLNRTNFPIRDLRQVFWMARLPSEGRNLIYYVEAVALEGAPATPQEMTLGELQQVLHSPKLLGYASSSIRLKLRGNMSLLWASDTLRLKLNSSQAHRNSQDVGCRYLQALL